MNIKRLLSVIIAAAVGPQFAWADYYVSPAGSDGNPGTLAAPFQTVERARQAVRVIAGGMTSDIKVYLRGGTYALGGTLSFDPGDSGRNGFSVIYQAYPGERPSLSGGRRLTGWTDAGGGVWRASSAGLRFRQLYVNGNRATRARTPNAGSYYHVLTWVGPNWPDTAQSDGIPRYIDVNASEIASWGNLNKVEMVISMEWMQANLRIESFTKSGSVAHVTPQYPDVVRPYRGFCSLREPSDQGCNFSWIQPPVHDAYFFENAREFLDQPGEWYLDEGAATVYYMPRAGEDMSGAVVTAPVIERIMGIAGGAGNPVRNLQFYGITFEHSNWLEPSDEGLYHGQGDEIGGVQGVKYGHAVHGAVHVEYADNIRFERNIIQNAGAGGVELTEGSRNISLIGNVVREIAAGGIVVAKGIRAGNADPNKVVRNITIRNNYVSGIGRDYRSGIGIDGQFASPIIIDHNEVTDVAYSGIGLDWRQDDGAATDDVQITNNHVYNVMNMLADGGGIYTFWVTRPQTNISGNYVHSSHRSGFGGAFPNGAIYLDEGTDYVTLNNNVLADADELIHTNWSGNPNASLHNSLGYNPASDAAIQANAGIQAAYQDIKTGGGGGTPPPPDTAAPSVPAGVSAQAVSSAQINLTWSASTDNVGVTGYRIFRAGAQIATAVGTSYSDAGLTALTAYSYTVSAYDAAGNASAQSAAASATTQAAPPPGFPVDLQGATLPESGSVVISVSKPANVTDATITLAVFDADNADEGVFTINGACSTPLFGAQGVGPDSQVISIAYTVPASCFSNGANTLQFTHTNTMGYRIDSAQVVFSGSTVDTQAPSIPAGLSAQAASSSQINLTWNASSDNTGVTGYRIYRGGAQIATTAGTSYSNTGLSASTAYSYTVAAYDAAGNASAQSAAASATTPAATPSQVAGAQIFADDFESGNLSLWQDGVNPLIHNVINDPTGGGHGKVLEMKFLLSRGGDGGWLTRFFMPGYNEAYVDFDVYFPNDWTSFTKLMAFYGARTDNQWSAMGQAGKCPTGSDFFTAMTVIDRYNGDPEPFRFYTYYPAMARESDGVTCWGRYGPSGTSMVRPTLGAWNRLRLYVKLNTLGQSDGLERLYLNGNMFSEWTGLSFGDTNVLKLNSIQITGSANTPKDQILYFDNIKVVQGSPGGAPPADAMPPAKPRNMRVQ